jgi:hypothetical protein
MGPISCPETSVRSYRSTMRKIREVQRSRLHSGGSPKSRVEFGYMYFIYIVRLCEQQPFPLTLEALCLFGAGNDFLDIASTGIWGFKSLMRPNHGADVIDTRCCYQMMCVLCVSFIGFVCDSFAVLSDGTCCSLVNVGKTMAYVNRSCQANCLAGFVNASFCLNIC